MIKARGDRLVGERSVMLAAGGTGGHLFPAYALPPFLRTLGYIFPLKYFIPIARGIYSKGVGLSGFWVEVTGLSLLLVFIIAAASRLFHQSLE